MAGHTPSGMEGFEGNSEDLEQVRRLIGSPMRSDEREQALQAWTDYKLARQAQAVRRGGEGKSGVWTKGDYIRSLTARSIDLRGAHLYDVCLGYADFRGVLFDDAEFRLRDLAWTSMKGARFQNASLRGASLPGARLMEADFSGADLSGADLSGADLSGANLSNAILRGTRLNGASLERANLVGAVLDGADLSGSRVYGASVWDVQFEQRDELQRDLVVTPQGQAEVTVDNIEVAQFVYLLLSNPRIRGAIDTVCRKGVLILGRFIEERKAVLDALREALRQRGYAPIIFDFEQPSERDITETVMTLAGLSRFIIADITNPSSAPLELQATVPNYQVPFVPLIQEGERPFAMFRDLIGKYDWVLDPLEYPDVDALVEVLEPAVIAPALQKHAQLLARKSEEIKVRRVSQYKGD